MFILSGGPGFVPADDVSLVRIMMGLFVLIGLLTLLVPIYRYVDAKNTIYAISDKRVLIVQNFPWSKVTALRDFREVRTKIRRDGSGSIKFINTTGFLATFRNAAGDIKGFYGVPDVRSTEVHLDHFLATNE